MGLSAPLTTYAGQTESVASSSAQTNTDTQTTGTDAAINTDDLDFRSEQLLVRTESELTISDPEYIVSSYDNLYLLQYPSEVLAKQAYTYYSNAADEVAPVTAVKMADETEADTEDSGAKAEEAGLYNLDPLTELNEAISNSTADTETQPDAGAVIAVLDTGMSGDHVKEAVSMIGDTTEDDNGHGTNSMNAILAENPDASIISIKVMDQTGYGTLASIAAGIEYAISAKADYLQMPLYTEKTDENAVLETELKKAKDAGIVLIGAAGNSGNDAAAYMPGASDNVVTVGSCDEMGIRRESSNYGDAVNIYAVADSTSIASARIAGYLSAHTDTDTQKVLSEGADQTDWIFLPESVEEKADPEEVAGDEQAVHTLLTMADQEGFHAAASGESISVNNKMSKQKYGRLGSTRSYGTIPFYLTASGNGISGRYVGLCVDPTHDTPDQGETFSDRNADIRVISNDQSDYYLTLIALYYYSSDGAGFSELPAEFKDQAHGGNLTSNEAFALRHIAMSKAFGDSSWAHRTSTYGQELATKLHNWCASQISKIKNIQYNLCIVRPTGRHSGEQTFLFFQIKNLPPHDGTLRVHKSATNPEKIDGQIYSVSGAVYGVYSDGACTNKLSTLTVGADGYSNTVTLAVGTYYVKETQAPTNMTLNSQVYTFSVSSDQTTTGEVSDTAITASLKIKKASADPAISNLGNNYSLEKAVFGVYSDQNCTNEIGRLTTDANGETGSLSNLSVETTYYVKEITAPSGYKLNSTVYPVKITSSGQSSAVVSQTLNISDQPTAGKVFLLKTSSESEITYGNSCYSLAGTTYGIYRSAEDAQSETNALRTLIVGEDGKSQTVDMPTGTYYYKEIGAGIGYQTDSAVHSVTIEDNKTTTINAADNPIYGALLLQLNKKSKNQISASQIRKLEGTEFTIRYYNAWYSTPEAAEKVTPAKTWTITTKYNSSTNEAIAALTDSYLKTGSDSLYKKNGNVVIPLGTLLITETKNMDGFYKDPNFIDNYGIESQDYALLRINADGSLSRVGAESTQVSGFTVTDTAIPELSTTLKSESGERTGEIVPGTNTLIDTVKIKNGDGLEGKQVTVSGNLHVISKDGTDLGIVCDKSGNETAGTITGVSGNQVTISTGTTELQSTFAFTVEDDGTIYVKKNGSVSKVLLKNRTVVATEQISFEIDGQTQTVKHDDLTDNAQQLPMTQGRLVFSKEGTVNGSTTNAPLTGVQFRLYGTSDAGSSVVRYATSKDGVVTFDHLPFGTYSLKESKTIEGYEKRSETWTVKSNDAGIFSIDGLTGTASNAGTIVNEQLHKFLVLKRSDYDQSVLANATFQLTGFSNSGTSVSLEKTTGNDGLAEFSELASGTYTLQETAAPAGYRLNPVKYPVHIGTDGTVTIEGLTVTDASTWMFTIYDHNTPDKTVTVTKRWKDGLTGGDAANRPYPNIHLDSFNKNATHPITVKITNSGSINSYNQKIHLLRNGVEVSSATVAVRNSGAYTFSALADYDSDGNAYTYTITADKPDSGTSSDWTVTIDNSSYTVSNKYSPTLLSKAFKGIKKALSDTFLGEKVSAATVTTVTFDTTGGSSQKTLQLTQGEESWSQLPLPTRSGYTCIGYYTSPTGGIRVYGYTRGITVLRGDRDGGFWNSSGRWTYSGSSLKLYAHWQAYSTVTFDPNGGANHFGDTSSDTATIRPHTQDYISRAAPTRSGYTFKGYYTSRSGGTQVYAPDRNGGMQGTVSNSYWQYESWPDYTKVSSSDPDSELTWQATSSSVTLYAQWTPVKKTLSFVCYLESGDTDTRTDPITGDALLSVSATAGGSTYTNSDYSGGSYDYDSDYSISVSAKTGYHITSTSGSLSGKITSDLTIAVYVSRNTATLAFNQQGGTTSGSTDVINKTMTYALTDNNSITAPTRSGYTFGGYYSGSNGTGQLIYEASGSSAKAIAGTEYFTNFGSGQAAWAKTGNGSTYTLYAYWIPVISGNDPTAQSYQSDDGVLTVSGKIVHNVYDPKTDSASKLDTFVDSNGDKTGYWTKVSDDVWTYTFYVVDPNVPWHVWEDDMSDYSEDHLKEKPLAIANGSVDATVTNTTTKKGQFGSLRLQKEVTAPSGTETTKINNQFVFTITLTDENGKALSGTTMYGDVAFTDGVGKVVLKNGESATMDLIPAGYHYSIEEATTNGFTQTSFTNSSGVIAADQTMTATCTNYTSNTKDQNKTGGFTLKKACTEKPDETFSFDITIGSAISSKSYTYTIGSTSESYTTDENGDALITLNLKNGESAVFTGLPIGTTYSAMEYANAEKASYTVTNASTDGTIASASGANDTAMKDLSTALETVESREAIAITFTNTNEQHPVTVRKIDEDGNLVADATLQVLNENGTVLQSFLTDGTAKTLTLDAGNYTLRETNAPDGYEFAKDVAFTVDVHGVIRVDEENVDAVTMTDIRKTAGFVVRKTDGSKDIKGALMQIRNSSGTVLDEWITNGSEHYCKLPTGVSYTLHEETAPTGYLYAADIPIVVAEDGTVTVNGANANAATMVDQHLAILPNTGVDVLGYWIFVFAAIAGLVFFEVQRRKEIKRR